LNLGHLYYKPGPEILRLTDNFFVSREDFQILADLAQSGLPIYLQSLPTTPLTPFIPSRYPWTR
ncbi:MAG: hypothetical protein LBK52_00925, partial [Deltaproteobacteria bacterium]|nr:hypothetical protein [Deltaproteobacteria bacterium]